MNFAGEAVRNLSDNAAPGQSELGTGMAAGAAALNAALAAAQTHAPGLVQMAKALKARPSSFATGQNHGVGKTGRWVRDGSKIILFGV